MILGTAQKLISLVFAAADKRIKRLMAVGAIGIILKGTATFSTPLIISLLVDTVTKEGASTESIWNLVSLLILSSFTYLLAYFILQFWAERNRHHMPANITQYFYKKFYERPYIWHNLHSTGYLSSAIQRLYESVAMIVEFTLFSYFPYFLTILLFIIYAAFKAPYLLIYFILFSLAGVGIAVLTHKRRASLLGQIALSATNYMKSYTDFIYNLKTVKKLDIFPYTQSVLKDKKQYIHENADHISRFNAFQRGSITLLVELMFFIPLIYFIFHYIETKQGIDLIVLLLAMQNIFATAVQNFVNFTDHIGRVHVSLSILSTALDESNAHIAERSYSKNKDALTITDWQAISFNSTLYKHNNEESSYVHRVQNVKINKGDKIAVCGESGEGKTTFINLLTHNIKPLQGQIEVDGTAYQDISNDFFHHQMTYVAQDIELFDMTLRDNLLLGKNISEETFYDVLKGCCLEELLERIDWNFDILIGEKGVNLSAGEKQRINLARSLLLDRPILVLDEVTANLDPHTTEKIWSYLFKNYGHKTIIAISHEPALLKYVNKFIVFEKGVGVEKETHL